MPVKVKLSRAVRWQRKRIKQGRCPKCGKPTNGFHYCARHRLMDKERKAKANGK